MKALAIVASALALTLGTIRQEPAQRATRKETPEPPPTSYDLIDKALAAGRINAETAHKYRVFAAFGDSRLPATFRGATVLPDPPPSVNAVGEVLKDLSPQTQAELAPFFMRPDEPGSWVTLGTVSSEGPSGDAANAGSRERTLRGAPFAAPLPRASWSRERSRSGAARRRQVPRAPTVPGGWTTFLAARGKAKVWAQNRYPGDVAKAQGLANALTNTIWDKLVNYMGKAPAADSNIANNGGGIELDFYLVHAPLVTDPQGNRAPAYLGTLRPAISFGPCFPQQYILLDSRQPLGSPTSPGLITTAAHELMHTITLMFRAVDNRGCGDHWILEASASWAENFVYPAANGEHTFGKEFLSAPHYPIDDLSGKRYYGAYLLPVFVERVGSSQFMVDIWRQFAREKSLKGVNTVLSGGWDKQWPEFLIRNWNRPPIDSKSHRAWDNLSTPALETFYTLDATGGPMSVDLDMPRRFNSATGNTGGLEYLSGWYYHFKVQPSVHTITLSNTLAIYKQPHTSLWGIVKRNGGWAQPEDWTQNARKTWCRDVPMENLEEFVIVIGNADWDTKKVFNPEHVPKVSAFRQGCSAWEGIDTSTVTMNAPGTNVTVTERVVARLKFESDTTFIAPGQPREYWKLTSGTAEWSGSMTGECSGSGSGTVALTGPTIGEEVPRLTIWSEGRDLRYSGQDAPWPGEVPRYPITCRNGVTSAQILLLSVGWWVTDDDNPANNKVSRDGRTIQAFFADSTSSPGLKTTHWYRLQLKP